MQAKITIPIFLILTSVLVQFGGYLNPDNAWLVYVADQMLAGNELHKDIVESNPPLVLYLMQIPAYFAELTGIASYHTFVFFVFVLTALSLTRIYKITENTWLRAAAVFTFTLFAGQNFGQREHLFIMLILPFVFARLEDKKSYLAIIMAALGFMIKPYYVLLWGAIELYLAYKKGGAKNLLTEHNYIISALTFCYLGYLFFIEKSYVQNILPLMLNYYGGFSWDSQLIAKQVFNNLLVFQLPLLVLVVKFRKVISKEILLFAVCNFVCILIVMYQQKGWSNHFYPASVFGVLLNILIFTEMLKLKKELWRNVVVGLSGFVLASSLVISLLVNGIKISDYNNKYSEQIIALLNQHATDKYVQPLSFGLPVLFPAVLYSDAKYGSRYGHLWMLPGIYADAEKDENNEIIYNKNKSDDEIMIIADIVGDFAHHPPTLIFVEQREYNTSAIGDFKFDFIKYLSTNKDFKKIFSNYEELTKIDDIVIYKYKESYE